MHRNGYREFRSFNIISKECAKNVQINGMKGERARKMKQQQNLICYLYHQRLIKGQSKNLSEDVVVFFLF